MVKSNCYLSKNDLPPAIDQPSMDSSAELSTETISHHLQPPERSSAQRDSDMESGNGMFVCVCVCFCSTPNVLHIKVILYAFFTVELS
ncbi:hypothetical protein DPMN_101716 [Dreissena polymorpha]|uniref:Uncharacterized protein n=1 Tax=Dreissena polymorpha TaxID=45954 RepID=A0A9D4LI31_DREPO|nr:hypothetical protein DPMN_101716 [Dreissena polymorpha]